jgi:hypothetical protein
LSSSSGSDGGGPGGRPARAIDERSIDRRLLALLIARHGAPQRALPLTADEEERRQMIARRERAMAAVEPSLVHHIERHDRDGAKLTRAQRSATEMSRDIGHPAGFDWSATRVREIGEVREVQVAEDLYDALEHRTPQAFLRDLHRPVSYFGDVTLRRIRSENAATSLARVRALVSQALSHRAGAAGSIELASRGARGGLAELRATLARPWEESRPANPLPMASRAPSAEDMQWFGLSGGYDPDL